MKKKKYKDNQENASKNTKVEKLQKLGKSMRSHGWVSNPSELVKSNIEKVVNRQIQLRMVQELGPTSFYVRYGKKTHKVLIGNNNTCTCHSTEVCIHRVYGLRKVDPLVWQKSFVDAEIHKILAIRTASRRGSSSSSRRRYVPERYQNETETELSGPTEDEATEKLDLEIRKKIDEKEVCPICYDCMHGEPELLILYCKKCGNNLHRKCMCQWLELQDTCPFCRAHWSEADIKNARIQVNSCEKCKAILKRTDRVYRCLECTDFMLCKKCIHSDIHRLAEHKFRYYDRRNSKWIIAKRKKPRKLRERERPAREELRNLQFRDINPDDYSMLLDGLNDVENKVIVPTILLNSIGNYKFDNSNCREESCVICMNGYNNQDVLKILPRCNHYFHAQCITTWLGEHSNTCPVCMVEVFSREMCRKVMHNGGVPKTKKKRKKKKRKNVIDDDIGELVIGGLSTQPKNFIQSPLVTHQQRRVKTGSLSKRFKEASERSMLNMMSANNNFDLSVRAVGSNKLISQKFQSKTSKKEGYKTLMKKHGITPVSGIRDRDKSKKHLSVGNRSGFDIGDKLKKSKKTTTLRQIREKRMKTEKKRHAGFNHSSPTSPISKDVNFGIGTTLGNKKKPTTLRQIREKRMETEKRKSSMNRLASRNSETKELSFFQVDSGGEKIPQLSSMERLKPRPKRFKRFKKTYKNNFKPTTSGLNFFGGKENKTKSRNTKSGRLLPSITRRTNSFPNFEKLKNSHEFLSLKGSKFNHF